MIVILSGEGPTDFGKCTNAQGICSGKYYQLGPMTILVKQMLKGRPNTLVFVGKATLIKRKKQQKGNKVSLVGKKQGKEETKEFYINAWMLAEIAQEIEHTHNETAIAILFRDCDGTNASKNGLWNAKWKSMLDGFKRSGFNRGVPMLPKPKSEAWLICAAKNQPYQHCQQLENDLPGNDDSPNKAKIQLGKLLGFDREATAEELCDWLEENPFDFNACKMPSFLAFKAEFNRVLDGVLC